MGLYRGLNTYGGLNMYKKQVWLNKESSPSTGNVVAYDGVSTYKGEIYRNTFLSVSDCYTSARLHKTDDDSIDDFIDKMRLLRDSIDDFITYLEKSKGD